MEGRVGICGFFHRFKHCISFLLFAISHSFRVKILVVDMFLAGLCIEKLGKFAKGIESRSRNIDMALELTALWSVIFIEEFKYLSGTRVLVLGGILKISSTQLKVAGYLFIRVGIHSRHGYLSVLSRLAIFSCCKSFFITFLPTYLILCRFCWDFTATPNIV